MKILIKGNEKFKKGTKLFSADKSSEFVVTKNSITAGMVSAKRTKYNGKKEENDCNFNDYNVVSWAYYENGKKPTKAQENKAKIDELTEEITGLKKTVEISKNELLGNEESCRRRLESNLKYKDEQIKDIDRRLTEMRQDRDRYAATVNDASQRAKIAEEKARNIARALRAAGAAVMAAFSSVATA